MLKQIFRISPGNPNMQLPDGCLQIVVRSLMFQLSSNRTMWCSRWKNDHNNAIERSNSCTHHMSAHGPSSHVFRGNILC